MSGTRRRVFPDTGTTHRIWVATVWNLAGHAGSGLHVGGTRGDSCGAPPWRRISAAGEQQIRRSAMADHQGMPDPSCSPHLPLLVEDARLHATPLPGSHHLVITARLSQPPLPADVLQVRSKGRRPSGQWRWWRLQYVSTRTPSPSPSTFFGRLRTGIGDSTRPLEGIDPSYLVPPWPSAPPKSLDAGQGATCRGQSGATL